MADNRLYLIHIESKVGFLIGKSYSAVYSSEKDINEFYRYISNDLALVSDGFHLFSEASCDEWNYDKVNKDGYWLFKRVEHGTNTKARN